MYLVIRYAVHEREIASVNKFDSWEHAMNFLLADVSNTYNETKEDYIDTENIECTIRGNSAQLSADDDEYVWTWDIVSLSTDDNSFPKDKPNYINT